MAFQCSVVIPTSLDAASFGVGDGSPQLDDKVVGEAERLQVRAVDRLREVHSVGFFLAELPDLSC